MRARKTAAVRQQPRITDHYEGNFEEGDVNDEMNTRAYCQCLLPMPIADEIADTYDR